MKTTKSTVHKLEIERDCGCKIARDYEDPAYKKPRGEHEIRICENHGSNTSDPVVEMLREMLREVLDKEALESKVPESAETIHPRTAALMSEAATPINDSTAHLPARQLRVAGSNGTVAGHRPATAPPKQTGAAVRRPAPKAPGGGPFQRANPNAGLSARAASKLGSAVPIEPSLDFDIGDAVPEDHRVTSVLEDLNFLGDEEEDFELEP